MLKIFSIMAQNLKRMIERMQKEKCSKWEIVKAVAAEIGVKVWDCLVKCAQGLSYLFLAILIAVIEIVVLVFAVVELPLQLVIFVMSPLWFPLLSAKAKAKCITREENSKDSDDIPMFGLEWMQAVNNFFFCTLMGPLAQWVYNRDWYPIEKRFYFIEADFKKRPLKNYPITVQKEYFLMAEDKTLLAGKLSIEAVNELFKEQGWGVRNILLKKCELTADLLDYILKEDDLSFFNLKTYVCSADCKKLSEDVLYELIKRLRGEYDEVMVIAYEQNAHTISEAQKAFEILQAYNSTHDLPEKIMFVLIKLAPKVAKAKEILLSQAERKNLSVGLIKAVYATQNEDLISEVKRITQAHADYDYLVTCMGKDESDGCGQWYNYCKLREDIAVKAQVAMPYKFYKEFVSAHCKLDSEAFEKLLLGLTETEDNKMYAELLIRNNLSLISEELEVKIATVKWLYKYNIYMKVRVDLAEGVA